MSEGLKAAEDRLQQLRDDGADQEEIAAAEARVRFLSAPDEPETAKKPKAKK